ncbi:ABC transporter permease [Phytoactinopolyspora endophytica]|uniref:ABC transporter permease n=1 Tax=Phytoactinopolyspora endophytica TaxID=1642495 RepID=UPI00101C85ED|nr:ABC transporter permease [Phytoactinopolyspora endophytica]
MSTTTDLTEIKLTLGGVARGEWIRFRTLRSHRWSLLVATLLIAGLGITSAAILVQSGQADGFSDATDPTGMALDGVVITQLVVGVLGALTVTGDYQTGLIRVGLATVPRRSWLFGAKAVVLAGSVLAGMLVAVLVSFVVTQQVLSRGGEPSATLTDPGAVRALVGAAGYLAGVGLAGLSLGFLLRSTAGAVAAVVGGVYLMPELLRLVTPADLFETAGRYLPSQAGQSMFRIGDDPTALSPVPAALVFGLWIGLLLLGAATAFRRRDA